MDWDVGVSLLVSVVLSDVVHVVSSDDDGSGHLGGDNKAPKDKLFKYSFLYLMIFPLMLTFPVKGHFLSM